MCKGAAAKVQDQAATAQEETMSSSIAVKNTFIEFSSLDEDFKLGRQMSAPAAPMKRVTSRPLFPEVPEEVPEDASPQDPAGPEPEPACKELDLPWGRLATGERWADEPEEPLEVTDLPNPVQAACAWVAPMPQVAGDWDCGGMLMMPHYGASLDQPMGQPVFVPMYAVGSDAQESPMPAKTAEKRRRRRAGGSLIDLAKKRMAERIVAEAAAGQHGAALHTSGVPAASSGAAVNVCSTCQRTAPCEFKFCHFCGKALEPVR